MRDVAASLGFALVLSSVCIADAAAQLRIGSVKSLRCTFSRYAVGGWGKDGAPETTVRATPLVLRFDAIDPDSGTAQLRNGTVGTEVTARLAEGYLHLM